ncbi:MAG: hypothetical protein AAB737_01705 [Patescibacteria group bacterium]
MEKETDTEFLARLMAEGFSDVKADLKKMDSRIDVLETKLDAVAAQTDANMKYLDNNVFPNIEDHKHRIKVLEEFAM